MHGGRMRKETHGLDTRGLEAGANPGVGYGRFGRMCNNLASECKLPRAALAYIAEGMIKSVTGMPITTAEGSDDTPAIPACYTYFGQFIDHDITFDPTPLTE